MDIKYAITLFVVFTILFSIFLYRNEINNAIMSKTSNAAQSNGSKNSKEVRVNENNNETYTITGDEEYYDEIDDLINSIYMKQLWVIK